MIVERNSRKNAALVSILGAALVFLIWWWWPEAAVVEEAPRPLPKDLAARPKAPLKAEPGQFQEVKLPSGETGLAPRLTGQQLEKLKKSGTLSLSAPGGGVITISQPDGQQQKAAVK
jgi:hypothetical protein